MKKIIIFSVAICILSFFSYNIWDFFNHFSFKIFDDIPGILGKFLVHLGMIIVIIIIIAGFIASFFETKEEKMLRFMEWLKDNKRNK